MAIASETINLALEETAALVRDRRVSAIELTEACLARIEAVEPRLNAFVTVTADLARTQAREADAEIAAGRYKTRRGERPLRDERHPHDGRLADPRELDP